ncbi:MAG: hypothetical protein ABIR57_08225 [Aeromicrobium sp.]
MRDARKPKRFGANAVSLVLAALLLAASIAFGLWLVNSSPRVDRSPTAAQLTSSATRESYGGDAYTGMQNAAADTENAVVEGTNAITDNASALVRAQQQGENALWNHLWKGLAVLIIVLAASNFIRVLQGCSRTGRQPI